ncbi:MAG: dUTP diphosphatase [Candidatus Thorarchaeota archaeon]|nr:dUTP diphosphatase [Candidatus Thorarchaeota archaeon]
MREEPVIIGVKLLSPDAQVPRLAKQEDAAFDLFSVVDYVLEPGARYAVPTGISVEIPRGFEGQVRPRSGLTLEHGVTVLNTPGTIDSGYRGEIKTIMINHGKEPFKITKGMRISQLAIRAVPKALFEAVDELNESDRGEGGFGSTGVD